MPGARRSVPSGTPYFDVEHDVHQSLVVLRRTQLSFPNFAAMGGALASMRAVVDPLGARRVLVDMSRGPIPRNDVSFESASRGMRDSLSEGFERIAFLMRTAVGVLQANRLAREEGRGAAVFRDEEEAIAWLLTSDPPPRRREPSSGA